MSYISLDCYKLKLLHTHEIEKNLIVTNYQNLIVTNYIWTYERTYCERYLIKLYYHVNDYINHWMNMKYEWIAFEKLRVRFRWRLYWLVVWAILFWSDRWLVLDKTRCEELLGIRLLKAGYMFRLVWSI